MTVTWERFAGNTDSFALRISFMADPDGGHAVTAAESASWGALQLWVDGKNLCAHTDQGESMQSAHWYLLPLIEWFLDSWNPLLHEERLPNRNSADSAVIALRSSRNAPELAGEAETVAWEQEWYDWRGRHALRVAREGGLFPNVVFRRLRDYVEVSWDDEPLAGSPSGFQFASTTGWVLLEPAQVAGPVHEVLAAALERLHNVVPGSERVADAARKLKDLTVPDQHDQRVRWLAGLPSRPAAPGRLLDRISAVDSGALWNRITAALTAHGQDEATRSALATDDRPLVVAGSCQAALLFSAVSPAVSDSDVERLAGVLISQYRSSDPESAELLALTRPEQPNPVSPAWDQGYDLAESLHDELDLDEPEWIDVEKVMSSLGIARLDRSLDDRTIRACSLVSPSHAPTVVVNSNAPQMVSSRAVRFTLAHELCHILYDRAWGRRLAIASGPWAPRGIEQRANAFAAMFLMPPHLLASAIADSPDPISEPDGIRLVAARLRVSNRAALEHLYNLTLMDEVQRDHLIREMDTGSSRSW
jgi:Zn-dependent peptidase ImmA (M78 family)